MTANHDSHDTHDTHDTPDYIGGLLRQKHHHKTLGAGSRRYVCNYLYRAAPMLRDGSDVRLRQAGHKLPMIGLASPTPSLSRLGPGKNPVCRSLRLWENTSNNA